jgi:hypothetical protein
MQFDTQQRQQHDFRHQLKYIIFNSEYHKKQTLDNFKQ